MFNPLYDSRQARSKLFSFQLVHQEIELLRDTKADRDEVEDAFRDKAGIELLNGLVTQEEFVANIKEFEKNEDIIRKTMHDEEVMWQVCSAKIMM